MTYDEIVTDCLDHLPGAVKAVIKREAIRSAIYLCEEANVLVQTQTETLAAGSTLLALSADAGFAPLRLVDVKEPRWLPGRDYSQVTHLSVELAREPQVETDVTYRVAVQPVPANDTLPPELARYRDAIYHCTLYRMQLTPSKSYTNPELATVNRSMWLEKLHEAKRHAIHGHHNANRIKNFRKFA